jgi:hypothetical protein
LLFALYIVLSLSLKREKEREVIIFSLTSNSQKLWPLISLHWSNWNNLSKLTHKENYNELKWYYYFISFHFISFDFIIILFSFILFAENVWAFLFFNSLCNVRIYVYVCVYIYVAE